jgi:hypothetical protein
VAFRWVLALLLASALAVAQEGVGEVRGRVLDSRGSEALAEGPLGKGKRGSWMVAFRKSYLQYILNRINFGDQAPLSFGFTDGEARLSYDLTPRHNLSLNYLEGASSVDRTRWHDQLGGNAVMTSGFSFTLLTLGSRYTPNSPSGSPPARCA